MPEMPEALRALLTDYPLLKEALQLALLFTASFIVYFIARRVLVTLIRSFAKRTESTWDDALVREGVFNRLAHVAPAFVVYAGIAAFPDLNETVAVVIRRVAAATIVLVTVSAASRLLSAIDDIYMRDPDNRRRPIKGYLQVASLILWLVASLLVVATLMDRSPLIFLSGLGAMTAVLLLVFRDTILSLVASVQLAGNDMIHVGDWIEMPKYGADGDVIDVALHTVKVQNWDKTITTIPTHALIADSFKNWRGMSASGGRRIKRSLMIDMQSVRFLDDAETERLASLATLSDYMDGKREEIGSYNAEQERAASEFGQRKQRPIEAARRRLTNIGSFRAYVDAHLHAHPMIRKDMTLLVRQLQPTAEGLPIELYCFTKTTAWNDYEAIQADLFDHLLAIAPEFGLRVFQSPSGSDLVAALDSRES